MIVSTPARRLEHRHRHRHRPDMTESLVSCLMVTRNRAALARRAVQCLARQTWARRELVIVDDGDEDYEPMLAPFRPELTIHYHRIAPEPGRRLGGLRNLSLELAGGDYCVQWDDDEWYHPQRIELQMQALREHGADACVLKWTLMHIDSEEMFERPYRADVSDGTPGTILHRRTDVRYPNDARGEDSVFMKTLQRAGRVAVMDRRHSHLFIRCFHGNNTWEAQHFQKRLWRTPLLLAFYLKARWIDRDLFRHPAFQLTDAERVAVAQYFADSRELGVSKR
jgi:glycosyltransferase involved in cell wall biosynthesis